MKRSEQDGDFEMGGTPDPTNDVGDVDALQFNLQEMLLLFSAFAIGFGLYNYVHPFIAAACSALILFYALLRMLGKRNLVVGGLAGFCLAMLLSIPVCLIGELDKAMASFVLLVAPCVGYIFGGLITELSEDDSF